MPAEAAATSRRRSWTAGWALRVRRRASTRPGLPFRWTGGQVHRVDAPSRRRSGDRAVGEGRGLRVVRGEDDRDAVRAGRCGEGAQDVARGRRGAGGPSVRRRTGPSVTGASARAMQTRCRSAWTSSCGRLRAYVADVQAVQPLQGGRLGAAAAGAAQHQGEGGVLPDVQLGDERRGRVDPGEAVAAEPFAGHRAHGVHRDAVEPHLAAQRREQAGQTAQQSGLAAAARAADGEDLALAHAERDPAEARGSRRGA